MGATPTPFVLLRDELDDRLRTGPGQHLGSRSQGTRPLAQWSRNERPRATGRRLGLQPLVDALRALLALVPGEQRGDVLNALVGNRGTTTERGVVGTAVGTNDNAAETGGVGGAVSR